MTESALEFLRQTPPSPALAPGQVGANPSEFLGGDEDFIEDDTSIEPEGQPIEPEGESASEFLSTTDIYSPPGRGKVS